MPITPFNSLRNPYSVNQTYLNGLGNTVTTGNGYAAIVRLVDVMSIRYTPDNPGTVGTSYSLDYQINELNIVHGELGGSGIDINLGGWSAGIFQCDGSQGAGQPTHPSYTAFISQNDYLNSDMSVISTNPQMWEVGKQITYGFTSEDLTWTPVVNGAAKAHFIFTFEIIEVVDEATYNNGTGVPSGPFISQATYGEIPVGTIMATPGDPNCNGCTDLYDNIGIRTRQGEAINQNPGYYLTQYGPPIITGPSANVTMNQANAPLNVPFEYPWTVYGNPSAGSPITSSSNNMTISAGMTTGWYLGSLWTMCKQNCKACRDPLALNYDQSTSPVWNPNFQNPPASPNNSTFVDTMQQYGNPQQDCSGDVQYPFTTLFLPPDGQTFDWDYNEQNIDCCLYKTLDGSGSGSGSGDLCPDNVSCGCLDPNAANFCVTCSDDCSAVPAGSDRSCCEYYHMWEICGAHGNYVPAYNLGINGFEGVIGGYPVLFNLTGNFANQGNMAQPNSPATNEEFMTYLLNIQGAPSSFQVGDRIQMRSMGMVTDWWCLEYKGPQPNNAAFYDNLAGGTGTSSSQHWRSNDWWNTPPATDGLSNLLMDPDCFTCTNPNQANPTYREYTVCDGPHAGEVINVINSWATDPIDHFMNVQPGNPNFWWFSNEIGLVKPNMSCTSCQSGTTWMLLGETLEVTFSGVKYCLEYTGGSTNPRGTDAGGWLEGIGAGTDNFIKIDPQDPLQLQDIYDNCEDCNVNIIDPCTPFCTDPSSPNYFPGPYPINACDCNGNSLPSNQAPGWNSCCDENPCDGLCNDPLANNYNPTATGCCGSGLGIGTPIDKNIGGNCEDSDTIVVGQYSTASFHQHLSTQANGLASITVDTIQYENMDSVWFGVPTPPGTCVGPNGGYMTSFAFLDGYIPHSSIQADINPGLPGKIYQTWDDLITQCITVGVTGVTTQTTFDELNILLTAWNPNGSGIPVDITPPTNVFCQCEYATYAQNNDCCTYNWQCSHEIPEFAQQWPVQNSDSVKSNVKTQYNKKFGLHISDINPRPESTFNHINDTGYIFPGLAYLSVPLRISTFRNLGLHFNGDAGSQGWGGGKQPKLSYTNNYPDEWAYAYSFMQAITDGTITNGDTIDLSQAYYKVKTNMVSLEGNFLNKKAKIITTTIPGGSVATGLYYHIIPAGSITIPEQFQSVFPTIAGIKFNTWKSFYKELLNYNLPDSTTTWESVSNWIVDTVENAPGLTGLGHKAAPEFAREDIQWMVKATSGCLCYQDPSGPYVTQIECETALTNPNNGDSNCCACVYGCTDPTANNYNPLASCDDGSCENCDPFVIRFCSDMVTGNEMYYRAYLGDPGDPQTCANSQALIAAWGLQNFWDIVGVQYIVDDVVYVYCVQWVDTSVQYYQDWLALNGPNPTAQFFPTIATTAGNFTYTPNNPNVNSDAQCQFCFGVGGCTDPNALNFNENCAGATVSPTFDDGCCKYCVYGCMNATTAVNAFPDINGYDNTAVYDCAVSTTVPTTGTLCPYPCAAGYESSNYSPCATCDDGTCEKPRFHKWDACNGSPAGEFIIVAPGATVTDIFAQDWFWQNVGSPAVGETINTIDGTGRTCYEYKGIADPPLVSALTPLPLMSSWEFDEIWNTDCASCACIYGCTDDTMCNYDAAATCDDGSCCNETGCLDPSAFNYCATCCCEGPCEPIKRGCTDPTANNYDPTANTPCSDIMQNIYECCDYTVYGCTDINAINFDPNATVNATSATDPTDPCKYLDQCKRAPREFGSDPTKKLNVECEFASDVYKEYRKQRYGLSNYCGSDLPDHLHEKQLCDWEDTKRPAYLSSTIEVVATYEYPIVDGEPNWMDPARPAWTEKDCGLTSDTDIDMYFMYDCTSMGEAAIAQQRTAADNWIDGLAVPFKGNVYHVLVTGERWVDWATTIFTGQFNNAGTCGGIYSCCTEAPTCASPDFGSVCVTTAWVDAEPTQNVTVTNKFWAAVAWGNTNNKPWYASAPSSLSLGSLTQLGYPPALTKREVLGVFFADEAATGGTPQPYHVSGPTLNGSIATWPQATDGTGTAADGSDSVITPCFKADYDEYITHYKAHIAQGPLHKATMVIYPAKPLTSPNADQRGFPLHALAAVDSGNNTPKDGRYGTGTAPNNSLVDLVRIEIGNPYWDTPNPNQPSSHTYGYGGLDNYGWAANVAEGTFDVSIFEADLEEVWDPTRMKCDQTECIVVNVVNQNNVAVPDYDIYVDGGFVGKTDEFGRLKFQIENAAVKTNHIINLCLCIETKGNCRQQQVKITVNEECAPECCVDPTGVSCETYAAPNQVIEGCTDPNASNYNPMATADDGSCLFCDPAISISETHINASAFGVNDGSINTTITNGTVPYVHSWTGPSGYTASTGSITNLAGGIYTLTVTDGRNCTGTITVNLNQPPLIYGCMDSASGIWPNINGLNQSGAVCTYPCTSDGTLTGTPEGYKYFCYNPDATDPDTCCEAGCTDPNAVIGPQGYCASCTHDCNMEPIGTNNAGWDSCCDLCENGCMDPIAGNYDPNATCDDGSCIYYWECDEAGYDINEITQYNYALSNINNTGIYVDTTCPNGYCDVDAFYFALADYYSSTSNAGLIPYQEVTAIANTTGSSNFGTFSTMTACPLTELMPNFPDAEDYPLVTIEGYTTENPYGPTGSASCYANLQIAQYGLGYVFPTWDAYKDWHNGAGGPNLTCSGSQIPVIITQDFSTCNSIHAGINSGSDMYAPDSEDNWIYYKHHEPQCTGYNDCECNKILTATDNNGLPGTHPTEQDCENAINCCGEQPVEIGGCIDDGYVDQHADFGTYGAVTVDNWWINAANAAGISYSQQVPCSNGIVAHELVINGGTGTVGTGVPQNYQYGVPALNYDPLATYDDGSCCYCTGCMDSADVNYEAEACFDNPDLCGGEPDPENPGCMDPNAITYNAAYNLNVPSSCQYAGCLDLAASNYGTFEANGLTSYTYQGTTYGLSDITAGCVSCCALPTMNFTCVSNPFSNPCFDGSGAVGHTLTNTLGNGGSFSSRYDLSRDYQLSQFSNSCQTFSKAMTDWNDPQSIVYAWSNAQSGDAAEFAQNFFFWHATNTSMGCSWSQLEIAGMYNTLGWTSPAGVIGFNVGSGSSASMVQKTYAEPWIISAMAIEDSLNNGSGILWYRDMDHPTTQMGWGELISELINTHGFDGTGARPDVSGLDARQVDDILSPNDDWPQIWIGFCKATCTKGTTNSCLPDSNGIYSSCSQCEDASAGNGNCSCDGC